MVARPVGARLEAELAGVPARALVVDAVPGRHDQVVAEHPAVQCWDSTPFTVRVISTVARAGKDVVGLTRVRSSEPMIDSTPKSAPVGER